MCDIYVGDYIRDSIDNRIHRVIEVKRWSDDEVALYLSNGGVCGPSDVSEVLLSSEVELGYVQ